MPGMDRRTFFARSAALGLGAVAWACARGKPKTRASEELVVAPTAQFLGRKDTHMAFALFHGQQPIAPRDVRATVEPAQGAKGQAVPVKLSRERTRRGLGGGSGTEVFWIWSFAHDFEPGVWVIDVRTGGERAQGAFQVMPDDKSPMRGDRAIPSKSPTTSNDRGVDPICTRDPVCSMHDVTIADALDAGKPVVIVFGTPRFCQSRTCGPTVDIVEDAKKEVGDKVAFVHVEVWRNDSDAVNKREGEAPTFAEWKLGTDPWLYFIDADGVVKDRWLGAFGRDETLRAVRDLVS